MPEELQPEERTTSSTQQNTAKKKKAKTEGPSKAEILASARTKVKTAEELSAEEANVLAAERVRVAEAQAKRRKEEKQDDSSKRYNHGTELSKKNLREAIIDSWKLQNPNPHVVDTIVDLAEVAAGHFHLKTNLHLVRHGLRATLEANKIKGPVDRSQVEDGPVPGELISRRTLWLLWTFSMFHQPDITFDQFLDERSKCKADWFYLGKNYLGKDFHEQPHGLWRDTLPSFTPIEPGYDQERMKAWLELQGREIDGAFKKNFLTLASRNSYKSSVELVFAVTIVLNLPDVRLLFVTETQKLSKGFLRGFRSYWEVSNPNNPTKFQQLFPEFMIPVGDGSTLTFESPMATLNLIQSTAEATSMDSAQAGQRTDVCFFDDPISNLTVGNEEQREASIAKFFLIRKLIEIGGLSFCLGTPWHEEDLYKKVIELAGEDDSWAVRVDPAWTAKEHAKNTPVKDLVEDDVELLFPTRLTFPFLQGELRANEKFFLSQNLCQFPPAEDAEFTVNFSEDVLRAHIRQASHFDQEPLVAKVMAIDVGLSVSARADRSAIAVVECRYKDLVNVGVVRDLIFGRWKQSQLAIEIVQAIQKHPGLQRVIIERSGAWESLRDEINRTAYIRGVALPYFSWVVTNTGSQSQMNKAARIKSLEAPLENNRLWFVASSLWNDFLIEEMVKYKGKKSNAYTKEDAVDAVERAYRAAVPSYETVEQPKDITREQELAESAMRRRQMYNMIFQTDYTPPPPVDEKPAVDPDPRNRVFGGNGIAISRRNVPPGNNPNRGFGGIKRRF